MAKFVCPHCELSFGIPDNFSGKLKCPKCQAMSNVGLQDDDNDDAELADRRSAIAAVTSPRQEQRNTTTNSQLVSVANSNLPGLTIATFITAVGVLGCLGAGFLMAGAAGTIGLVIGLGSIPAMFLLVGIVSPIFTGVNELHKCRKLLEIIAQGK